MQQHRHTTTIPETPAATTDEKEDPVEEARPDSSAPLLTSQELNAICGPYEEKYDTRASIGKGAFGFVKMAKRRRDGKEVCMKKNWMGNGDLP